MTARKPEAAKPKSTKRGKVGIAGALALSGALASVAATGATASAQSIRDGAHHAHHVLLLSVDGLHQSDLAQCAAAGICPTLATLSHAGTTYTNAKASEPSDSAPGLMALVTGGDPKLTGVYYDDAYDRTLYGPAAQQPNSQQDCSGAPGSEAAYFENLDVHAPSTANNQTGSRTILNESLDPTQFDYARTAAGCVPVAPNDYLRTNSIFSVAHQAGLATAWADKHPVYNQEISGHGTPNAVDDPFNTEINADLIPSSLVDTRGNTVTFPLPNPDGTGPYFITDSVGDTEAYDTVKVDAILNQIDGRNSAGQAVGHTPAIYGMNFQTVSVAQKLIDPLKSCVRSKNAPGCDPNYLPGGYVPGSLQFTPQLSGGIQSVDHSLGAIVAELGRTGQLADTTIIVTAKHGQSPIDPSRLAKIGHAETEVLTNAGITPALVTDDDIALVWLNSTAQDAAAAAALRADQSGADTAHIARVLAGDALADRFNSPTADPRTPDVIVQPIPGTIYSTSGGKVAEHGGFAADDTHVALVVINGARLAHHDGAGRDGTSRADGTGSDGEARVVTDPVRTYQVAPTILATLGLDPAQLDAVKVEHVPVLPGAGAGDGQA